MVKNENELIRQIVSDFLCLRETGKTDLLNDSYDPKKSLKIGRRLNKNLKSLLGSDGGTDRLRALLFADSAPIRFLAARYLYPVFPEECRQILINYRNALTDERERMELDNVIDGLTQGRKIFADQFRKLYHCNDLSALNREKKPPRSLTRDEKISIMYQKQLSYTKPVVKTIYSKDKSKRYVLLENDDGTIAFRYETIVFYDEEELLFLPEDSLPAYWQDEGNFTHIYGNEAEALKALRAEPEYKDYF